MYVNDDNDSHRSIPYFRVRSGVGSSGSGPGLCLYCNRTQVGLTSVKARLASRQPVRAMKETHPATKFEAVTSVWERQWGGGYLTDLDLGG